MTTKPRCAVVIPTFNGSHLLSTCLEALLSYPPERCEMNVIVVDDASSDGTVERFGACDEDVTMVARERNGGFAHACNDGAAAAGDAEYLVFLNNDTIPIPGWLDALVDEAREHGAAAVGSKLLYPNGTVQHAGITIGQDRWPHNLYVGLPGEHDAVNRAKSLPAVTAACLLIRRDAFEQAGGFDTAFLNGYEDVDLCLRLGEEGHEVRYCPRSVLYHLESVTRWADYSVRHTSDNDRLYAERWLDRVKPDDIEHYLADGLISVQYGPSYPVRMAISPLLATVDRETEPEDRLEQLLSIRTEELMDMRAQQIRGALEGSRREPSLPLIGPMRARSGGTAEVVQRGEFHSLGSSGAPRHRVSVLMPLMDAGAALRQTLPILLEQEVDAELEIVAVDSASTDDTVEVLEEFGATVLTIDPTEFDHGLTRNLLAAHARGDYLVLLNGLSRPCDENWLAPLVSVLAGDPTVAGVASRVLPYPEADLLTRRDVELDPSGSEVRSIKRIADRRGLRGDAGRAAPPAAQLPHGQRRDPGGRAAPHPLSLGAGDRRGPALVEGSARGGAGAGPRARLPRLPLARLLAARVVHAQRRRRRRQPRHQRALALGGGDRRPGAGHDRERLGLPSRRARARGRRAPPLADPGIAAPHGAGGRAVARREPRIPASPGGCGLLSRRRHAAERVTIRAPGR